MNKNYFFVWAFLSFCIGFAQQAGDLDTSFGVNGIVRANQWNASFNVKSHQVLSDGKIMVAGEVNNGIDPRGFVMRLLANGDWDPSFGDQGRVFHPFFNGFLVVKVQSDGKILVGGSYLGDYAVARYLSDGTLDSGFAYDGSFYNLDADEFGVYTHEVNDIEIQSDNKIVCLTTKIETGVDRYIKLIRLNPNGIVDATFNETGNFNFDHTPVGLSIQSDGKILVGGYYGVSSNARVFVSRYHSNGNLDTTFGVSGMRNFSIPGATGLTAKDMQLQPDGRILIGGQCFIGGTSLFMARLNINGTLDSSFSGDGIQTAPIALLFGPGKIALQSDGKIIQMDTFYNSQTDRQSILLARYNANGELDNTFVGGSWGGIYAVTTFNNKPGHLSIVNDQLYISGNADQSLIFTNMLFARFNLNPTTADITFGINGSRQHNIIYPTYEEVHNSAIQADDKVVVLSKIFVNNDFYWGLLRYNVDGSLDTTFASGGGIGLAFPFANFQGMALDSNNNIIIAGNSSLLSGYCMRITPQGILDSTFGNNGIIYFPNNINFYPKFNSIKIQSDNKIVLAGGNTVNNLIDFVLVRLNPNGTLDSTFGLNGISQIGLNNIFESISDIEVLSDGKILALGYTQENFGNNIQAVIARFNAVGLLDPTFGTGGKYFTNFPVGFRMRGDIALQTDGKIISTFETTNESFVLFRLNSNGTPDMNFGFGGYISETYTGIDRSTQLYYNPVSQDITLLGTSQDNGVGKYSLARFTSSGFLDFNFGNSGWVMTETDKPVQAVSATPTGDGRIVLSGVLFDEELNDYDIFMAKYFINESLGLENPNDVSIQLFPNPVSETLFVQMTNELTVDRYRITDMNGKVVLNGQFSPEQGIQVASLSRGVYFISLDGYQPIRFIKR